MVPEHTTAPATSSQRDRTSGFAMAVANVLLSAGVVALAGGLAGLLLGRTWTVAVALCGDGTGRQGAAPLWYMSLLGLALAVLVAILALVLLAVSLVRRDKRVVRRSAVALLVGVLATGACYAGAIVVIGDAPLFCF
jgi:hypothetical protein